MSSFGDDLFDQIDENLKELSDRGLTLENATASTFLDAAAEGGISNPLDSLEEDETSLERVFESENKWAQIAAAAKIASGKKPSSSSSVKKKKPDTEKIATPIKMSPGSSSSKAPPKPFPTASETQLQMSKGTMAEGRKQLMSAVSRPPSEPHMTAETIVKTWARDAKRTLTGPMIKALTGALMHNPSLDLDHFDKIILGWDIRGDHNVNEIKNVMDSQQQILNEILASQRGTKEAIDELLKQMNEAYVRILTLHTRSIPIGTPIELPDQKTTKIPDPQKNKITPPTLKAIGATVPVKPKEPEEKRRLKKTVDNLLKLLGKTYEGFHKYVGAENVSSVLQAFIDQMTAQEWKDFLLEDKVNGPTMKELVRYISAIYRGTVEKKRGGDRRIEAAKGPVKGKEKERIKAVEKKKEEELKAKKEEVKEAVGAEEGEYETESEEEGEEKVQEDEIGEESE